MAINGPLECKGPYKIKAFKRYVIYSKIYDILKLSKSSAPKPKQDGCYPMVGEGAPGFVLCKPIKFYTNQAGMYHWCNDNCNAEDPNCPEEMCECEERTVHSESSTSKKMTTITTSPTIEYEDDDYRI